MRVLLDTNVILDSMIQRPPWHIEADLILEAAGQGQIFCAATPLSLATVFYVGRRIVGTAQAREDIRSYLRAFDIVPIDKQTLDDAQSLPGNDFVDNYSDCCVHCCCRRCHCYAQRWRLFPITDSRLDAG